MRTELDGFIPETTTTQRAANVETTLIGSADVTFPPNHSSTHTKIRHTLPKRPEAMKKTTHDSVFAREEWLLNESTQMDYASMLITDEFRSQSATPRGVEESWIDLDHDKHKHDITLSRHIGIIEEDEAALSGAVDGSGDEEEQEDAGMIKRARFNTASPNKNHFDLNTSLTTILAARRSAYDSDDEDEEGQENGQENKGTQVTTEDSQVIFMDISNASSVVSSTQLSVKRSKKRKMKRSSKTQTDLTQGIVLIGIIASLSFSAGYALGQSRRHY